MLVLLALVSGPSWAELPVDIPDPNLRAAIENRLQVSDPTPTDMLDLTNLTQLDLHSNRISDISALSNLVNMWFLAPRENPVSDLSPLAGIIKSIPLGITFITTPGPLTIRSRINLRFWDGFLS